MSNRNHYDKYLKAKTNAQTIADIFRKEQEYYKERIIETTKELCDGATSTCDDTDVTDSYNAYIKCCIRYLKWKDVTEMIQKDKYGGPKLEGDHNDDDADDDDADDDDDDDDTEALRNARQELDKRIQEVQLPEPKIVSHDTQSEPVVVVAPPPEPPRYIEDKAIISFANKMCIRKKTMDDFIKMKPAPVASSVNLPQIRDYHDELDKRTNVSASASANSTELSQ